MTLINMTMFTTHKIFITGERILCVDYFAMLLHIVQFNTLLQVAE